MPSDDSLQAEGSLDLAIPRIPIHGLAEAEFVERFLLPNRPCVLTGAAVHFGPLLAAWSSFESFLDDLGDHVLSDAFAKQSRSEQPLRVRDFLAARPQAYLKDWHLQAEREAAGEGPLGYELPSFLGGEPLFDWLNCRPAADASGSGDSQEYRFVYAGKQGSGTPLHFDVLASYSWSCNIVGRKHWTFFHESSLPALMQKNSVVDLSQVAPAVPRAELIQERGELVFVPSRWAHCVENLEDCVSVNHNWLNAASLERVWAFLRSEWDAVCREMESWGIKDEDGVGKRLLRTNSELDFDGYAALLERGRLLAEAHLGKSEGTASEGSFVRWTLDKIAEKERELREWLAETET